MATDQTIIEGQSAQPETENLLGSNTTIPSFRAKGRILRSASVSTVTRLLDYNPSGGMWQATGTAIAHAPNVTDLRSPDDVFFDVHGRGVRRVSTQDSVGGAVVRRATAPTIDLGAFQEEKNIAGPVESLPESQLDHNESNQDTIAPKVSWGTTFKKAALATWRFILTPTGLFILIYGLNVIAWGAMLFFLMLGVSSMSKERKEIWIEIDSQILNALFCLTSWGLAPWRIRDTYWLLIWHFGSANASKKSIMHLAKRNSSWYRMRDSEESNCDEMVVRETLTGKAAPPTKTWKMDFVVINMLLNSLFQVGMATFMWEYDRHTRPAFGVALFIGLGCFSSLLAGLTSWWEGRKVKRIEGAFFEAIQENEKHEPIEIIA
ncbi:hypothetical protein N7465_011563 [Penicillium sp. CMV-2018d]|nr:hypothetical protein N7465_011563 [Penicillium sp. CMV-2018d]